MRLLAAGLTALAVALLPPGAARAELLDYSYHWSVSPGSVIPAGTGSVMLALAGDGSASSQVGAGSPTTIPAVTLTTSSSATTTPDTFNASYALSLHLTDTASGESGDLTFSGTLKGTLTATASTLVNKFGHPFTKHLKLGGHQYFVTIDPGQLNLPAPGAGSPAQVNGLVTIRGNPNPPPGQQTPEPSALVLAGVGLCSAGLAWRRLRRAARPA
jgi:hypothetical protein